MTTVNEDHKTIVTTWSGLANGDDGVAVPFGYSPERTVHAFGTFGGGTVYLEGSCEPTSPSNWQTLTDPQGNLLALTADKLETVMENTMWVRPRVAGGAAGNVTVHLMSRFK